jgi:hypothetical protein
MKVFNDPSSCRPYNPFKIDLELTIQNTIWYNTDLKASLPSFNQSCRKMSKVGKKNSTPKQSMPYKQSNIANQQDTKTTQSSLLSEQSREAK